jgi:hypothetical protein
MFNYSKRARDKFSEKSSPSKKHSISIRALNCDDSVRFAFSTSRRNFYIARLSFLISLPLFFLNRLIK